MPVPRSVPNVLAQVHAKFTSRYTCHHDVTIPIMTWVIIRIPTILRETTSPDGKLIKLDPSSLPYYTYLEKFAKVMTLNMAFDLFLTCPEISDVNFECTL